MQDLTKRAVILSAMPVTPALSAYLQPGDTVVACDAGYRNAAVLGIQPDLIVGDFDSQLIDILHKTNLAKLSKSFQMFRSSWSSEVLSYPPKTLLHLPRYQTHLRVFLQIPQRKNIPEHRQTVLPDLPLSPQQLPYQRD